MGIWRELSMNWKDRSGVEARLSFRSFDTMALPRKGQAERSSSVARCEEVMNVADYPRLHKRPKVLWSVLRGSILHGQESLTRTWRRRHGYS